MIETPLFGRFYGENRRLVFQPALPYLALVRGTIGVGAFMVFLGLFGSFFMELPLYPQWWQSVGAMVGVAGVGAMLSLTSISFDLRERHYRRRQGASRWLTGTSGSLNDLDALVLIAETIPGLSSQVTYHLVLHWKGKKEPPMVLQQDTRSLLTGQPLNSSVGPLLQAASAYANALGLPLYDNSHFPSPNPVRLLP